MDLCWLNDIEMNEELWNVELDVDWIKREGEVKLVISILSDLHFFSEFLILISSSFNSSSHLPFLKLKY